MATAATPNKYACKRRRRDSAYCPVCVQMYTDPRHLSICAHSFCLQCIIQIQSQTKDASNIICPKCTGKNPVPNSDPEELDKNTGITKMLHMMQHARLEAMLDEPEVFCDACEVDENREKADRDSHCKQCDKNFCVACAEHHKVDELFKSHTWCEVEVPEPDCEHIYCKYHPKEEMLFHCDECEVLLCPVCAKDEPHKDHKQSGIEVIAEEQRQQLAVLKEKLIERHAKDAIDVEELKKRQADLDYARDRITEGANKARAVVEKWRQDNLRVLAEYMAKVDSAMEQNEEEGAGMESMLAMLNERLDNMELE